jgi:error-prone DNA polymerase
LYTVFLYSIQAALVLPAYAELHCLSNFSFLRGASHPEELVTRAHELGYAALAITDEASLAGVVRAHQQAKQVGLPLLIGAEFRWPVGASTAHATEDHSRLILLAQTRAGYGHLAELISRTRARARKGHYRLETDDLLAGLPDCLALLAPAPNAARVDILQAVGWLAQRFGRGSGTPGGGRFWLAFERLGAGSDSVQLDRLRAISRTTGVPLVAAGDVHMHRRSRRPVLDVLTAVRLRTPLDELGFRLKPNAERHLRSRLRLAQQYPADLLEETLEVASRCAFSLDELRYEYPHEICPAGHTPTQWLRTLTEQGARQRWPAGVPTTVRTQIEHELALIAELHYEPYFLTVGELVAFARGRGILCQGRGSAANSAVCYCLGITEVDPSRMNVLFERFISRERGEPPDIDVDFEHHRREEVIQHIYSKYGRERAALAAAIITWRPRSALRDVGFALGIERTAIDAVAKDRAWWDGASIRTDTLQEAGLDPSAPRVKLWLELIPALLRFPRHLTQHSGGFVIARDKLTRLVPIENTAMDGRSVIQWDKDDLDALGILKIDVLALGMLSAIRRALTLIGERRGIHDPAAIDLETLAAQNPEAHAAVLRGDPAAIARHAPLRLPMQDIPAEDPSTYEMISRADTVGVFQIESRAQMAMLPRLQPRCFYDLVIEVAIVRPGPIQGGMVHPYLRRRQGLERVDYPRDEIRPALERTLGVPIFQEQVMQIAILAAGFTPGEADQLRRSMAAWRRKGGLGAFQTRVVEGMLARGYERPFAEAIFAQIEGFGEYGFPESHAASFALLVYVSCWLKCHEPAAFLAALLNSQPMGFYAPAQLVRDARAHGVEVRPATIEHSQAGASLEETPASRRALVAGSVATPQGRGAGLDTPPGCQPQPAVRLGLEQIQGLSGTGIERILTQRALRPFSDVEDLARRAELDRADLSALAKANALAGLAGHRRNALWQVAPLGPMPGLLAKSRFNEPHYAFEPAPEAQEIIADYQSTGLTLGRHPIALLRAQLAGYQVRPARELWTQGRHGMAARASGLVTHRQRPETARGTVFVTLEDETGALNIIVPPALVERDRRAVLKAQLMTVYGVWECDQRSNGHVAHLVARRVVDHSALLGSLSASARNFR